MNQKKDLPEEKKSDTVTNEVGGGAKALTGSPGPAVGGHRQPFLF
jgi:hypothetical protein